MKKFILASFFTSFTYLSQGQILNIEEFRIDKDTTNVWAGNIGIGFSAKKQQTNFTTFNAGSTLAYFSQHHSYMNINHIKFIRVEGSKVISEGYTHLRTNFLRKKLLSYESFIQLQYDRGRGLEKRELLGLSLRFRLLATPKTLIAFNTGSMYEHEVWKGNVLRYPLLEQPGFAETKFIKSISHIFLRGDISKNVYLFFVTYYQARFERFFNPRIITDVQLNFKINKYFSLSNQLV